MARLQLTFPEDQFYYSTPMSVRVTDINAGNHLGNDSMISMISPKACDLVARQSGGDLEPVGGAPEAAAGPAGASAKAKFDFSSLSLEEIEEELNCQQANFERDVARLRKQYERRGRALRAARAARSSQAQAEAQ